MAIYALAPSGGGGSTSSSDDPAGSDSGSTDDPADTSTSSSTSTSTQTGGEHTYDVDDSVADDPALDYSSINDPRQTAEDTTGTAGGEVESSSVSTGYEGIAGGLDPSGPDSDGDGISDSEEEQIDAISDATHTTTEDGERVHTTDLIPDDPRYIVFDDGDPETDSGGVTEPDWDGDGEPGGNATERIPDIDLPDVPSPDVDVEVGGGWKVAAAVAIGAGVLYSQASSSGGSS